MPVGKLFTIMKKYATVKSSYYTIKNNIKKMPHNDKTYDKNSQDTPGALHKVLKARYLLASLAIFVVGALVVPKIYADTLQAEIEQLQSQNDLNQSSVDTLLLEAKSFEEAIAKLQAEIAIVERNIATNQASQIALQVEIKQKQVELDRQKSLLGDNLKAMYVKEQISTVEILATSKSLSDFIDAETYRGAVQAKVQRTLTEISKLQNQLQEQKVAVDKLLESQRIQQAQLDLNRGKQNDLLNYNVSQRATYNSLIDANQGKIRELQARQAALNQQGASRVTISGNERGGACDGGSGNGGYRLASGSQGDVCDAPKDAILDWAGVENRECTSYAYWYFKRVAGNADFTASGDAKYWVETSNYPVHDLPKAGAIGVIGKGEWGHVVIVQAVGPTSYKGVSVPAGQVLTSEMNSEFTGKFSNNLRGIGSMKYIYK